VKCIRESPSVEPPKVLLSITVVSVVDKERKREEFVVRFLERS